MTRRISNPYERKARKTERTNTQKLVEWSNEIIRERNLLIGLVEQETSGTDRKQPDVVIKTRPGSDHILCVMELKNPAFDPFNESELISPARTKAAWRRAPYFATSNFQELVWFNTKRALTLQSLEKQIVQRYTLSQMEDPDTIEQPGIRSSIRRGLERFLMDLAEVSTGKRPEPKHPIDEILVYRLQSTIRTLAIHYKAIIASKVETDKEFLKNLRRWFVEQGWNFSFLDSDYAKAARQTAYLLVNKVLFYSVIQPIRRLDPLEIPKSLISGARLQDELQSFFNLVLKIDYETIYSADFIDQIAFPDNREVVEEIKELVDIVGRYDFSKIGYDVIGRIFEQLIPAEERHILGQYFTNPDVVDIILRFCLRSESDKVLDPACGAGTFLVRAYQHKKLMNQRLEHEAILPSLWGVDIAKFPAHLTTINLAINNVRSDENYPRVIQKDFFELLPDRVEFAIPESWRQVEIKGLGKAEKVLEHPRFFDCIVGNPPYTRHLEIEDIQQKEKSYKEKLIHRALTDVSGQKKIASISKRAGIYAYFFVHGTKFLHNGGHFGFIVSNSWLDADYGKGLQEHFLTKYKIVAIIESKVERWFIDADINTSIVILEKASGEERKRERETNVVRFVYLQKSLRHFVPAAENIWEKEISRLNAIDALWKTILAHSGYYENDELRIFPKTQKELWEEAFNEQSGTFVGAKWGKYIRAPKIFFTILEKGKALFLPLGKIAEVNEGKPTGANDFFYVLKDVVKKFDIERQYLRPGIMRPRGKPFLNLRDDNIERYFLNVEDDRSNLRGTNVLGYIKHGERLGLQNRATFKGKEEWYRFGLREPSDLLVPCGIGERLYCSLNSARAISSNSFTEIRCSSKDHPLSLWTFLNSAVGWLFMELHGRTTLGGGMLKLDPTDLRKMPVFDPIKIETPPISTFKELLDRPVETVFKERKSPDRAPLDKFIMVDCLGLTEKEQKAVYDAVEDLVRTRYLKAQSLKSRGQTKDGLNLDKYAEAVISNLGEKSIGDFVVEKILSLRYFFRDIPALPGSQVRMENTIFGWRLRIGRGGVDCSSEIQARYLRVFAEMGFSRVPMPADERRLPTLVDGLETTFIRAQEVIEEYASSILQKRTRDRLIQTVWTKIRDHVESAAEQHKS